MKHSTIHFQMHYCIVLCKPVTWNSHYSHFKDGQLRLAPKVTQLKKCLTR